MPGGSVDVRAVQYAASMKMYSSKNGQRPDKHSLQQQGKAKRFAAQAQQLASLKHRLKKHLFWLICQAPSGSQLQAELLCLLRDIGRLASCLLGPPTSPAFAMAGGGGAADAGHPGRGPPVELAFQLMSKNNAQGEPQQTEQNTRSATATTGVTRRQLLDTGVKAGLAALGQPLWARLGALGTALGLGGLGIEKARAEDIPALSKEINPNWIDKETPPGIVLSYKIDRNTYFAWKHAIIDNDYTRAINELRLITEIQLAIDQVISPSTPSIDPGYHVVAALVWSKMINNNLLKKEGINVKISHENKIKNISDKNMINFALAISYYNKVWNIKNRIKTDLGWKRFNPKNDIEKPFLSAIFGSAGINTNQHNTLRNQKLTQMGYSSDYPTQETDADNLAQFYMNLPDNRYKKLILDETIENLQKLNKNSKEILIAAWSSFWLTNYYDLSFEKEIGDITYKLEREIRNKLDHPIRGPPYYYYSKGNFNI